MSTAQVQGPLWGARAVDYADVIEPLFSPVYETVFDAAGVGAGATLLDVGCGPGLAAQQAARRGARVAGLDAADASLAIARQRTPDGDFRAGELEALPWPDASFDVITSFNAVQFAADLAHALREARRVAAPGGRVALLVWGPDEECETLTTVAAVRALVPAGPAGSGVALWAPGRMHELLEHAGFHPTTGGAVDCSFVFPDQATAVRGLLSTGICVAIGHQVGEDHVRRAVGTSLEPFRARDGSYRQRNRFVYALGAV